MASETPAVQAKNEDGSRHGKARSLQHPSLNSSKEKGFLPTGIKNVDRLEKVGALKTEKLPRQTAEKLEGKNSVAPPLWTSQKPWPGRKASCVEEPVKNMSNVPRYLHRTDKGDNNIHEKALNFGVLEWGLLERWTYHQNCATDLRGGELSRNMPSSLSRRKKSHSGLPQKRRSVVSSTTKTCARDNSKHIEDYHDSRISFTRFPTQHDKHLDADFCSSADISGHKHNTNCSRSSDMKTMKREGDLVLYSAASPSRYKIEDAAASRLVENQNGILAKAEFSGDYPNQTEMPDVLPRSSQDSQVSREYLQVNVDSVWMREPFMSDGWLDERKCNNLSGDLAKDFDAIHRYPCIPHSCPLPFAIMSDEPDTSSALPSETAVQVVKSMTDDLFSRDPSKKRENCTTHDLIRSEEKATSASGKTSSVNSSYAGHMSTSCSLKIGSSKEKSESVSCLYNSHGDQANRNSKSRQSPLRRLLDPLLKLKNNPVLPAVLNRHSCDLGGTCKSSDGLCNLSISSVDSTFQMRRSMDTSKQSSQNGKGVEQNKSNVTQMNQAYLQLAWKNGLPLFMLSSPGNEVLAAMVTSRSISNNDDLDFRIFSLKDSKKKSKFWSNPGSKSKNHQLISNVAGQLKVSLRKLKSYEHDGSHDVREFVLLGAELAPAPQKHIDPPLKNELAAVVLKVPLHKPKCINIGMLCNSKYRGLLPTNSVDLSCLKKDDAAKPGITVIFPGGVHGLSTDGEPSPLIERWRSGGTCDCGGWDEGCKLTILSDKFQEQHDTFGSLQDCQNCRFELSVEGGSQEKAFSMVPFSEGQYAVYFLPSISLLQVFAICIAILHGRKLSNLSAEHKNLHELIANNQLGRATAETHGDSTSYVPNHPPLSPVGRA